MYQNILEAAICILETCGLECLHGFTVLACLRRHVTGQLFAAARVSCAAVQEALSKADPARGTAGLDKLVEAHTCVQQEEEMRSMLFAQLLRSQP